MWIRIHYKGADQDPTAINEMFFSWGNKKLEVVRNINFEDVLLNFLTSGSSNSNEYGSAALLKSLASATLLVLVFESDLVLDPDPHWFHDFKGRVLNKSGSIYFAIPCQDLSGLPGWTSPQPSILEPLRLPETPALSPAPLQQVSNFIIKYYICLSFCFSVDRHGMDFAESKLQNWVPVRYRIRYAWLFYII